MESNVITYKTRLVTKGYHQRQGIDYDETFCPIVILKSIRILLVIAAHYDYEIWQMEVNMVFLNGNLTEKVYMAQLECFIYENDRKVCKLLRSIYVLKQASGSWNVTPRLGGPVDHRRPAENLCLSYHETHT